MKTGLDTDNQAQQEAKSRAWRLKKVRALANCKTQKEFSDKYNIPHATLKAWESGVNLPLSSKGAKKIAEKVFLDGVEVYPDWLLYGTPPEPKLISDKLSSYTSSYEKIKGQLSRWTQERLSSWISTDVDAIYCQVQDESMEPFFGKGDHICAIWVNGSDIENLLDQPCLIETPEKEILCRTMKASENKGKYSFYPNKYVPNASKPLENITPNRVGFIFEILPNPKKYLKK